MQIRFPDRLRLRVPRGLAAAIKAAAEQRHTTPAELARQALLCGLASDGVKLSCEPLATTPRPK
jgi:hypothetical protein